MKFGLPDETVDKICAVLARHPQVEKAILYGSRAKGNPKNGSDIDLTLCGGSDLDQNILTRIIEELDELLLPYTIDLSLFNYIRDPDVLEHIRRVGIALYEKKIGTVGLLKKSRSSSFAIQTEWIYNSYHYR